jgi:hypothetical protein
MCHWQAETHLEGQVQALGQVGQGDLSHDAAVVLELWCEAKSQVEGGQHKTFRSSMQTRCVRTSRYVPPNVKDAYQFCTNVYKYCTKARRIC